MKIINKNLDTGWKDVLENPLQKDRLKAITSILKIEKEAGKHVFPASQDIFAAFQYTPFHNIKVVILWQDPYHGIWQAHGMSFSVPEWVKIPPSLRNIYKELWVERQSWDLSHWAKQWVLLLNAILTVEATKPASHSKIWWWEYTDEIITQISLKREWVVFLLWGAFAAQKKELIDSKKHLILTAPHPSPFSAYKGFFWCGHFRQVNEYLEKRWEKIITW
jgi:uracil-DNA glycosylase